MKKLVIIWVMILISSALFADEDKVRDDFGYMEDVRILFKTNGDKPISAITDEVYADFSFKNENSGVLIAATKFESKFVMFPYLTTNGGKKWEQNIYGLYEDPSDKYTLDNLTYLDNGDICCTIGAIKGRNAMFFRSTNFGNTWLIDTLPESQGSHPILPTILFKTNDTIYFQLTRKMYKNDFGGGWGKEHWYEYVPKIKSGIKPLVYMTIQKAVKDDTYFMVYIGYDTKYYVARSEDNLKTWETFEIPQSYSYSFIDHDTWLVGCNKEYKPAPIISLIKYTNSGKNIDTIFKIEKYIHEVTKQKLFGDSGETIVFGATNRFLAVSNDSGKNFEFIFNNFVSDSSESTSFYYTKDNRLLLYGFKTGYIMEYNPKSSVNAEIGKFSSNIYPNPANQDSPLYIELQNESARSVNCKVYNSSGELIKQSKDMFAPKGWHIIDFTTDGMVSGSYFLIIESNGEILAREKFIVK